MTLGEKIKELRSLNRIFQEYIAEQLGVSRQSVSKWETGLSLPSTENLIALAKIFQVSVEELTHPDTAIKIVADSDKEPGAMRQKPSKKQLMLFSGFTVMFLFTLGIALYLRFCQYPDIVVLLTVLLSCILMLCAFVPVMIALWKFLWKAAHTTARH